MTHFPARRLSSHLLLGCVAVALFACSRSNESNQEYSLAVANQAVSSKKATGGSAAVQTGVLEGVHGMDALPGGWQRNPSQCQPSAVPPASNTCFDASSSKALSLCDSCNYDTQCSGPNGTCVPNAPNQSAAVPILGCGGVQADLTLRFPCLDTSDVVHVPLCNRGHDKVTGLVWIGVYSGASNIPSCVAPGSTADKGQVSFDTTAVGGLLPGQCVDVHFSRTSTSPDGNISNKLGWKNDSLPNGNPQRALAANFNAASHECNFCNNWTVFNADQCGALGGTPPSTAGTGGAPAQIDGTGGATSAGGTPALPVETGGAAATGGAPNVEPVPNEVVTAVVGVTDSNGTPVTLVQGNTTVTVETRTPGGDWKPVDDVVLGYDQKTPLDVVIVADNSGSEHKHLTPMRDAMREFATSLLAQDPLNRIGLVRVSTTSKVLSPLTEDLGVFTPALDGLFIKNGWTALYDGIALGNQTLEAGTARTLNQGTFCYAGPYRSIVVFTDGRENNSLGQELYVDNATGNTTIAKLNGLSVAGMRTALYTVGIGRNIDAEGLRALAIGTGGRYVHVGDYDALTNALANAAAQLDALLPVCFSPNACGDTDARVTVIVHRADGDSTTEKLVQLPALCQR